MNIFVALSRQKQEEEEKPTHATQVTVHPYLPCFVKTERLEI